MSETEEGDRFGCRLELYLTDPMTELDPEKRETEVTMPKAIFSSLANPRKTKIANFIGWLVALS